jgi:hypothetical protein
MPPKCHPLRGIGREELHRALATSRDQPARRLTTNNRLPGIRCITDSLEATAELVDLRAFLTGPQQSVAS